MLNKLSEAAMLFGLTISLNKSRYTMPNTKRVELIITVNDIHLINSIASSRMMALWMDLCILEYSINITFISPQSKVYRVVIILSLLYVNHGL